MKKSLFFISSIPFVSLPIVAISSCSTTISETDFQSQYDLFTPDLVKQDQVSKNLLLSIDNNNISNIYSTPINIFPEIDFSFSFDKDEKEKSLTLYVQIYNYQGQVVKYSDQSDRKEITKIINFQELPAMEQEEIDAQYINFNSLVLTGNPQTLPSSINNFNDVTGSNLYQENLIKYNYYFEFTPNNAEGNLGISLKLTTKSGYPLNPKQTIISTDKKVTGFMSGKSYQESIDNLYKGANEIKSINLANANFLSIEGKYFASGINTTKDLVAFYKILQPLQPGEINIPCFLEHKPDCDCKFDSKIILESFDYNQRLDITINFYDKVTKELVNPSPGISRSRNISNFTKPSYEMLKATMDAYDKYKQFQAKKEFETTLPSTHNDVLDISTISNIDPKYVGEFSISVDSYPTEEVPESTVQTFIFRPQTFTLQTNDATGLISSEVVLELKIGDGAEAKWIKIKPPSSVRDNNGKPVFGNAKNETNFYITGFLTTQLKNVNDLYEKLNNRITTLNNVVMTTAKDFSEFENVDFPALWLNLYTELLDPLGIEIINDIFKIKYTISNNISSSVSGNKIYKWVSVQASVNSIFTEYEYEFLNINNLNPKPNFKFDFVIEFNKI